MHSREMAAESARILTRISISLVFLWFGINQIINPETFMGYLPTFLRVADYARSVVLFNGIFEIIVGSFLIAGLFVRITAFVLSIHLLAIILGLGYNDIAIRDIGLMLVTIGICIGGADKWTVDYWRKRRSYRS